MKTDKRNQRRGGFYWFEGKPYISVTNVLRAIDKPALRYWFGTQVFLAMVKNPTLSEKEALSAPYKTSDTAKSRGTTIHSIVESFKNTGKIPEGIPEKYAGYANAFQKWMKDNAVELVEQEKTIISKKYGYAGTADLIVRKGDSIWVCDVKTGKGIYQEAHLQLSAYKQALIENGINIERMGVILLKETGNYKFEEVDECFDTFLATKKLWEFLNKDLIEKIGYEN